MRCPKCSDARSRVSETKFYREGVRRRRECKACGHRYSTDEKQIGNPQKVGNAPSNTIPPSSTSGALPITPMHTFETMESLAVKWIHKVMDERE